MRMLINLIPHEKIELYDLQAKSKNEYVHMEIRCSMYGLPQSDILANKLLKERLAADCYSELPHTSGLFNHDSPSVVHVNS